ncbi:MAG: DUF1192 domain-containing protein [Alphaproteobacteria bacterium]|nr:DUF1192 domain-containing protein [Alphaproteobacteria bacterium]MDX5367961.1 DUF1192 domain-containing protein [Alphaproteobacteria bacterium]MDX5462814.1 DUF1192 domain-containing protein [Alphaproteobacteria bacterium]
MIWDEVPPPKPEGIVPGADLSRLSIEELEERIATLRDEIARCEQAIAAKRASKDAADSVFGGPR